ncbi:MAG: SPASM domain-containing protein [Spirochaetes bacterium]|nr:SPASM domain-containing protein [Spirochaetota bacterium]
MSTFGYVTDEGHIAVPEEFRQKYGLNPGERVKIDELPDRAVLYRPVSCLRKVYVEPTNGCNMQCGTCMRNAWEEPEGMMATDTYARVLEGIGEECLRPDGPRPVLFFGGLGEPLLHPDLDGMIQRAKALGARVELITNGTMLSEDRSRSLIDTGLDMLWVSIDGASKESYADVRLGNEFENIVKNLEMIRLMKYESRRDVPELGISFVAMKRNISQLPRVVEMAFGMGVKKISVSNVLPYTSDCKDEILYGRSMYDVFRGLISVTIPRMDGTADTMEAVGKLVRGYYGSCLQGFELLWPPDKCPFIAKASVSVRWDGEVSPCIPLMYTHESYLEDRVRKISAYSFGNIRTRSLRDIWNDPGYMEMRAKLESFEFSPCTLCNSCELADGNEEDCFGNTLPTCGGCLWAQGFINCP